MTQYETAFLISPDLEEEETEKVIVQMAEVVSKKKGKMINEDRWGKRRLAYPIKKFEEAFYVFFHYEGDSEIPSELERRFKQTEAILRYLTVKKELKENIRRKKKGVPAEKKRTTSLKEEIPEKEGVKVEALEREVAEEKEPVEEEKVAEKVEDVEGKEEAGIMEAAEEKEPVEEEKVVEKEEEVKDKEEGGIMEAAEEKKSVAKKKKAKKKEKVKKGVALPAEGKEDE